MMIHRFRWVLILAFFAFGQASASNALFKNGKTDYVIFVSDTASESEKTAAKELRSYLGRISGAEFPVSDRFDRNGKNIFIGYSDIASFVSGLTVKETAADDESFVCESRGGNIFIHGGSERGTLYGVYSFLEKCFGVRWYAPDCTVVPKMKSFRFDDFSYSEAPSIKYRFVQYNGVETDHVWCARNRNNHLWTAEKNDYGGLEAYWNAHTMGQFVQSGVYFKDHPEYFGFRDGERVPNGQLCLSNPDVLGICIDGMKKAMDDNPGYWVYSMSQNDNVLPCECENCKAIEKKYGGHSGLILWFVNQVADAVGTLHPDKYVGTFAYQYTRQAPKGITPRDNVVIRLCSIECCFGHPIDACQENRPFVEDLKAWSGIAPKLFIWDYVVDFRQYLAPFPNFGVLSANIKTFKKYNAVGVQEEAQYQTNGGEFSELRAWVLAKLLWNPDQDTEALVKEFITAYYGSAAPFIQNYFDLCQSLVKEDTVLGIYIDHNDKLYSDDFVTKASGLLQQAEWAAADDHLTQERVDAVSLQTLYLKLMRNREASMKDGTFAEFKRIISKGKFQVNEWNSSDYFLSSFE